MDLLKIILLFTVFCCVACEKAMEENQVEARGKGKYALLTHLGILLATKVGLYKIVLGIALVIASMKIMVLLAWVLAAYKYVPDLYPQYKHGGPHYHLDRYGPPTPSALDTLMNVFKQY